MSRIDEIVTEFIDNGLELVYEGVSLFKKGKEYKVANSLDGNVYTTNDLTDAFEKFDSACFEDETTFEDGQDWRNIK